MNIKLTGSNGYIGQLISKKLEEKGHSVSGIERNLLYRDTENLKKELQYSDVVINLAGAPILQRWTEKNKEIIYDSRVVTTRNLVAAINGLPNSQRPKKVVSASAIGIYKSGYSHTEESHNLDEGFVGKVVKDWENSLIDLSSDVQKVIFRLGVVFGREAQTIKNMLLPFKLGSWRKNRNQENNPFHIYP